MTFERTLEKKSLKARESEKSCLKLFKSKFLFSNNATIGFVWHYINKYSWIFFRHFQWCGFTMEFLYLFPPPPLPWTKELGHAVHSSGPHSASCWYLLDFRPPPSLSNISSEMKPLSNKVDVQVFRRLKSIIFFNKIFSLSTSRFSSCAATWTLKPGMIARICPLIGLYCIYARSSIAYNMYFYALKN